MIAELWADFQYRVRALFRRSAVERELDAELAFHVERETEENIRRGMASSEARRRARLAFGGVDRVKEESREARGTQLLESLFQDVRYAWRGLWARPAFCAGVALTLALGIGANTTMFGIVDRLMLRSPAYLLDADHVHRVYMTHTLDRNPITQSYTSIPRYQDFVRWTHTFSNIAAFAKWQIAVGDGEAAREWAVAGVSASYFGLFDARPAAGRFITHDEDRLPNGSPVVVLAYPYWQTQFGGRQDVLGRQLRIGRMLFTVIGVAPERFTGLDDDGRPPSLYIPISAFAWNARPHDNSTNYDWGWLGLVAKRAPGVSVDAANADLTAAFARSWSAQNASEPEDVPPLESARPRTTLGPLQVSRGPDATGEARVATWVCGVAAIVLLVACANVANLLLARALTRRRELSLRLALGASRGRLMRQVGVEATMLALIGGAGGLAVAQWGGGAIRALFLPPDVAAPVLTDGRTLAVALGVSATAALLIATVPAAFAAHAEWADGLRSGGRGASAPTSHTRNALLFFQAALSVVLLIGAGLFVRSLSNVRTLRLGYDASRVLLVTKQMRGVPLNDSAQIALESRLTEAADAIPGVVAATPAPTIPFTSFEGRALFVAGIDSVDLLGLFIMQAGSPDYFRTVGTRIVRGRALTVADASHAPLVAVVSEGMAHALWPGRDALGQCIRIERREAPCTTVVGIAEDQHLHSFTDDREFTYYLPLAQYGHPTSMILVRVASGASSYLDVVRRQLQRLMPGNAYVTAVPLQTLIDPAAEGWRVGATMFVAFGCLALALAAIGLYSVLTYAVAQQRQEIGVRLALGARDEHVLQLVLGGTLRLVVGGVISGSVLALLSGRLLAPLLFNESATDPAVYLTVAATLLAVAAIASALPAWQAVRVDPNTALRTDG
jgi:predicted permease